MSTEYKVGPIGAGVVGGSSGTPNLVGVGSAFTTQFVAGDALIIIDSGGNHDEYEVATVVDATHITLTGNLSETYTDCSYYGLRDADQFVTPNHYPSSIYSQGDPLRVGDGTTLYRGYPVSRWEFERLTVAEFTALRSYLISLAFSGVCYVRTRDADDAWANYYAVVDFQAPGSLTRWALGYMPIILTFKLVTEV